MVSLGSRAETKKEMVFYNVNSRKFESEINSSMKDILNKMKGANEKLGEEKNSKEFYNSEQRAIIRHYNRENKIKFKHPLLIGCRYNGQLERTKSFGTKNENSSVYVNQINKTPNPASKNYILGDSTSPKQFSYLDTELFSSKNLQPRINMENDLQNVKRSLKTPIRNSRTSQNDPATDDLKISYLRKSPLKSMPSDLSYKFPLSRELSLKNTKIIRRDKNPLKNSSTPLVHDRSTSQYSNPRCNSPFKEPLDSKLSKCGSPIVLRSFDKIINYSAENKRFIKPKKIIRSFNYQKTNIF
ncbi:unnamed protein product [Blepharisma stoltei]|uniref:Uncharacterized protein n=1 Tax=Blepharisma stoltei TaxID=1481888 RepID=A0AAU9JRG9_9CILI|nr:unnamed protein product [Blepharisma stoltei]